MKVPSLSRVVSTIREDALDASRIYLGVVLFVRGALYVGNASELLGTMQAANVPASTIALAHYVALAHLGGGLLLTLGLATRLAALVQIPPVLGAILYVHRQESLLGPFASLHFALVVLVLLSSYVIVGAGRVSCDALLREPALPKTRLSIG